MQPTYGMDAGYPHNGYPHNGYGGHDPYGRPSHPQQMNPMNLMPQMPASTLPPLPMEASYAEEEVPEIDPSLFSVVPYKLPAVSKRKKRRAYQENLAIDKILHRRVVSDPSGSSSRNELFVTFKNLSYLHATWERQDWVEASGRESRKKLKKFLEKNKQVWNEKIPLFEPSYILVDRIFAARAGPGWNTGDTRIEYLVKFVGLPYSHSTFEFEDDFIDDKVIRQFEKRMRDFVRPRTRLHRPGTDQWKKMEERDNHFKNNNRLREWQVEGVSWLRFNWYNGRGCILADEMGLGKTVQIVATLNHIKQVYSGPFLVVAPLSTLEHWKREIEAWTDMYAVVYQGTQKDREVIEYYEWYKWDRSGEKIMEFRFDVLITTYESVMRHELLPTIKFKMCVVDEAHRLKNHDSKLSRFLRRCRLEFRILLTGTPIQNNVKELWALLNFVNPSGFSHYEQFYHRFGDLKTPEQVKELHKVLKPYFLRRVKEDVAKFIPEKRETIIEVELTKVQKQYYRAMLEKNREFLYKGCSGSNVPNLRNIMVQLRKICNHPYLIAGVEDKITRGLVNPTAADYLKHLCASSGKFVLVEKLLPKLRENKENRILIFSQMKMVLDLLQYYLKLKQYPFERIDGAIKGNERQSAIDRFNDLTTDTFVFLLSTRAGGFGINLSTANTVIIFDSDWNPQNDIQAMARCHRLGTRHEVQVYRLITARSYEKKMFLMASKKLGLGQAVMGGMSSEAGKLISGAASDKTDRRLTDAEIDLLLKHGAYDVFREDDSQATSFEGMDIEEILKKRTTDFCVGGSTSTSTFSKATFITSAEDGTVDIHAPDFWERIMPDSMDPLSLLRKLNRPESFKTPQKRQDFIDNVANHVQDVQEEREQGQIPRHLNTVMNLVSKISNNHKYFDYETRMKAQEWLNILGQRAQRKGSRNVSYNEDDLSFSGSTPTDTDSSSKNGINTRKFPRRECHILEESLILTISSTNKNLWETVKRRSGITDRSCWEIACWCCAFVRYAHGLAKQNAGKEVFSQLLNAIKQRMPDRWADEHLLGGGDAEWSAGDEDDEEFSLPGQKRKRKSKNTSRKKSRRLDPLTCTYEKFPSLKISLYPRHIESNMKRWIKTLRIGKLLRRVLHNMKDVRAEFEVSGKSEVAIDKDWTCVDDLNLVAGCAKHGVGGWDTIHNDSSFGYRSKYWPAPSKYEDGKQVVPGRYACCYTSDSTGFMISCDRCEKWYHGSCIGVSQNTTPDVMVCWICRPWPSNKLLISRLASVLNAYKKANPHKFKRLILSTGKSKKQIRIPKKSSQAERKPIPNIDDVSFPYRASGGVTILKLGRIKWDDEKYCSKSNLFPVGYAAERQAASYITRGAKVTYRSEILEGREGPIFRVTASDDPDHPFMARSATNSWTAVMVKSRKDNKKKVTCSGPKMYGLSEYDVRGMIEQLPNADKFKVYWEHKASGGIRL